jgi:hypothetical protein
MLSQSIAPCHGEYAVQKGWLAELRGVAHSDQTKGRFKMDFEGYCVKCRAKRDVKGGTVGETAKGRPMAKGTCPVCGTTVTRFLSAKEAGK